MASLTRKLRETFSFVRYGRAQLEEVRSDYRLMKALVDAAEARAVAAEAKAAAADAKAVTLGDSMAVLEGAAKLREQRIESRANSLDEHVKGLHEHISQLAQAVVQKAADADLQFVRNSLAAELRRETGWLRDRLSAMGSVLDQVQSASSATPQAPAGLPASIVASDQGFYPALEQQFRGSRAEIRARLDPYRAWLAGLPSAPVADLGCGRGEMLELFREWGVDAVGIDSSAIQVEANRERGLHAICADALEWLVSQPSDSLAALTCFHLVEHLPFGVLLRVVDESRRVLLPGGRLILETPNPENLLVATQSFWLDPTHRRPLPPPLLEFVVTHAGFEVEQTLRLNPPEPDSREIADQALRMLLMQGRDYAVLARKPAAAAAR